jgi:aminoglycoside phosphotransferase family enzyme/predicted kinase
VMPIISTANDGITIGEPHESGGPGIVDFAVKMRQFDQSAQADRRLTQGMLTRDELRQFGKTLAVQHAHLTRIDGPINVVKPIIDNFSTLDNVASAAPFRKTLSQLHQAASRDIEATQQSLAQRHREGFTRECHGDLHLQNLILTEQGIRAFDCLEFDSSLRAIDVWNDAAFLVMDCCVRGRDDLGYSFIDGYLDVSGDYEGVTLLPLYARYRSMVRAKVAALRHEQTSDQRHLDKLKLYVEWAHSHQHRPPGQLIINCGTSGSGKSYWAKQLVPELAAIRLRSDVLRKYLHGLAPDADSGSSPQSGLYGSEQTKTTYQRLAALATRLLELGENVIVDCTNLRTWQRQLFYKAAEDAGSICALLYLTAPKSLLMHRIEQRQIEGNDASEADLEILEWQLSHQEPPDSDEPVVHIQTENTTLHQVLKAITHFKN